MSDGRFDVKCGLAIHEGCAQEALLIGRVGNHRLGFGAHIVALYWDLKLDAVVTTMRIMSTRHTEDTGSQRNDYEAERCRGNTRRDDKDGLE